MNQKTVKIDEKTYDQLKYISSTLNLKQSRFLRELINQLFQICGTFQNANISYQPCVTASYVFVQFSGKNRLIFGVNSLPETEAEEKLETEINEKILSGENKK